MVEVVVPHTPLVILHSKIFNPSAKFVTVELASNELVITPLPEVIDHVPIPTVAALPASVVVGELIHKAWFAPAFAKVGARSTCILIVDELAPQTPFTIVHSKIFNPAPRPVTEDVANVGVVIVPLPEITDQVPVPTSGVFPVRAKVGVLIQIDWLEPALAIVGTLSTCIFKVDVLEHIPLAIVHSSVFNPSPKPVMVLVGEFGFDIVPLPAITDQVPIPVVGVFPANTVVGLLIHKV